jgi:two-component system invasion response regulator UvrY
LNNQAVGVLLVDDHPVVREGYRRLLSRQDGLVVVGEAADGGEGVRLFCALAPDVVLMDLSMPGRGGIDALRQIKMRDSQMRALVVSMHLEAGLVSVAMAAGARGYVTKSAPPEILVRGVREVAAGRRFFGPDVAAALAHERFGDGPSPLAALTPRELEILRRLAEGASVDDIADALCVSPKTVRNQHYRIRAKLGARTDVELVRLAIRTGLTPVM